MPLPTGKSFLVLFFKKERLPCFLLLLVSACADPGSPCYLRDEAATWPPTEFETLNRVCNWPHRNVATVTVETGDVWPAAPRLVPTMLDVQRQAAEAGQTRASVRPPRRRPNDFNLCRAIPPGPDARALCYRPMYGIN